MLVIFCSAVLLDCNNGNEPDAKVEPTNLVIVETISSDGSGLVTFVASAENAVKYQFYFGEDALAGAFNSVDGKASYGYQNTGSYNVKVIAYSVDEVAINKTIFITIQVNEPTFSNDGYTTPLDYAGMTLVWQDEFNGSELNPAYWTHETGNNNGWGNHELEYYQAENTLIYDGHLVIKAKKENVGGFQYTSSRMVTQGKKEFKYGRVDIRAILPKGQGLWPALWMLGSDISTVGWPKCGEIDIMEMIGGGDGRDNKVYGTPHWDNGQHASYGGNTMLSEGKIFADEFHVFSIVWDAEKIVWYLDDVQYHIIDIRPTELDEFQKEFFFIFNVAVGGDWPGNPNETTLFPQRMIVDYIRMFQPI